MALERQLAAQQVGQKIAKQRVRLQLTQEEAATRIGVTHRAYQRWESGESMPYPRNIQKIAMAFEVEIDDLYAPEVSAPELPEDAATELAEKLDQVLDQQAELLAIAALVRDDQERLLRHQGLEPRSEEETGS